MKTNLINKIGRRGVFSKNVERIFQKYYHQRAYQPETSATAYAATLLEIPDGNAIKNRLTDCRSDGFESFFRF